MKVDIRNIYDNHKSFECQIVVDCLMGEWGEWSGFKCSNEAKLCGKCVKTRTKDIIRDCEYGGKCDCKRKEDPKTEHRLCKYDCTMATWGQWTPWSCEKRNGELSLEKVGHRWRIQPVLTNCSITNETRTLDDDLDCSCTEQVEDKSKEMAKCGVFLFIFCYNILRWKCYQICFNHL